ncbi:hypothetical protein Q8A67_023901 [Cirrhinus molitorella]|uniref:Ig-like domain-containing protein n=1 Tax=Cirrhinus molitorella TaxID=172907 RepID=A0AA88TLD7_9TELE|nr:hypothetical protein Q8A67_023901 [Cirrhinus molitorella]
MIEVATDGSVFGVNSQGMLFQRIGVTCSNPAGTDWISIIACPKDRKHNVSNNDCSGNLLNIPGSLAMTEVAADGSVFGVNSQGRLFQRIGITHSNPSGTDWQSMTEYPNGHKHVSFDLGVLLTESVTVSSQHLFSQSVRMKMRERNYEADLSGLSPDMTTKTLNRVWIDKVCLEVTGVIGGSVVLPCSTKHDCKPQDIDVFWRHNNGKIVHDIIKGSQTGTQNSPYKNRAESFPTEYLRGNFSIKLINLTHSDAGKYICHIRNSSDSRLETIELIIKESTTEETKPLIKKT